MLSYLEVRICFLYPREESTHDHHEQKTNITTDYLHRIGQVQQCVTCCYHVSR